MDGAGTWPCRRLCQFFRAECDGGRRWTFPGHHEGWLGLTGHSEMREVAELQREEGFGDLWGKDFC